MAQNIPKIPLFVNVIKNTDAFKPLENEISQFEGNTEFLNMLLTIGVPLFFAEPAINNQNNKQISIIQFTQPTPQQFLAEPFELFTLADQSLLRVESDFIQQQEPIFTIKERLWPKSEISYQERQHLTQTVAQAPVQQPNIELKNLIIQEISAIPSDYYASKSQSNLKNSNKSGIAYINIENQADLQKHANNLLTIYNYQFLSIASISVNQAKVCYKYETTEEHLIRSANAQIVTHIISINNKNDQVEKVIVQLEPIHLGTIEIVFSPNKCMNNIQINVEKESTYFTLKHNSHQLISMLCNVGLNQSQINLNFSLQDRKANKKLYNDIIQLESEVEPLGKGLDNKIKTASMWYRASVNCVNWLI